MSELNISTDKKSKNAFKAIYRDEGVQRAAAGVAVAAIVAATKSLLFGAD